MKLRDKKVARIKLGVLKATRELLGSNPLRDLRITDICDKAEISKVTLFKYFPRKEDIFLYYLRLWELQYEVEQLSSPKRGLKAIYHIFEKITENGKESLGLMLGLTAFMANLAGTPPYFPLEVAERKLLYPDNEEAWDLKLTMFPEILVRHVNEAIADRELAKTIIPFDFTRILISVAHGVPLAAHATQHKDLAGLYREHLDILFSSSKTLPKSEN